METSANTRAAIDRSNVENVVSLWWLKLVTAAAWLLLSVIVFRFDWSSVTSISVLFGVVMLGAAASEAVTAFGAQGWWRLVYALLSVTFVVIGIVAFVHPGNTFQALAAVMSFYFVIHGAVVIVASIATRGEGDFWWLSLVAGIVELLLGFWAAGYFGHAEVLLVVWVGALALTRAIGDVVAAFAIRGLR